MRTKLRSKVTLLFLTLGLLIAIPAVALADQLDNQVDDTLDGDKEQINFVVGDSSAQTVNLALFSQGTGPERNLTDPAGTNSQVEGGCNVGNLSDSDEIEVQAISSGSAASVKWAATGTDKVKFAACSDLQTRALTVTPGNSEGTADVTFKITSTGFTELASPNTGIWQEPDGSGRYDLNTARFTVQVTPPPNTPPSVSVTGVEHGATYNKGAVPTAGCSVTDTEDGLNSSTTAATLTTDSTGLDSDGLGLETVECSYTDGGGATETASATYTIRDPSAPVIGYTLNPATPDGANGWYKSNVSLTWTVTENESPNSLLKTGCVDQNITADQAATEYKCSATSSGGSAAEQSVTIKRDGTAPSVVTNGAATGTLGDNNWYTTAVSQPFRASDALSGLVGHTSPHDFSIPSGAAEGENVSISSGAFDDNAGNSNSGTSAGPFKIDLTKPTIQSSLVKASTGNALAPASTGWYNLATGAPTVRFTCNDPDGDDNATNGVGSGVASCEADHTFPESADPQSKSGNVSDNAGHTDSASAGPVKVDLSKPTSINFTGGANPGITDGATYDFGEVPAAPTGCTASDNISGMDTCSIQGGGTSVGQHTITATAKDKAGNEETRTLSYTVRSWTMTGFYQPVDMNGVYNTVKSGSTVPLKFEVFKGVSPNLTELTDTLSTIGGNSDVKVTNVTCEAGASIDDIETTVPGNTVLRYDTTAGQFIFNWQTPKNKAGSCYKVTIPTKDGVSSLTAYFKLK